MTPSSAGARFRAALAAEKPLQVPGATTAYHALLAEQSGFKALYLSGGGVAAGETRGQASIKYFFTVTGPSGPVSLLYDTGAEIRLGRDGIAEKLGRLDEILSALGPNGIAATRIIHLDGPAKDRIPIRLAESEPSEGTGPLAIVPASSLATAKPGASGNSARPPATGGAKAPAKAAAAAPPHPLALPQMVKKSTAAHNPAIPGKRPVPAASVAAAASSEDLDTD